VLDENIRYFFKRVYRLGPTGTAKRIKSLIHKKTYAALMRRKALAGRANYSWKQILKNASLNPDFHLYLQKRCQHDFISNTIKHPLFLKFSPNEYKSEKTIIEKANLVAENKFDLLGSGLVKFENNEIPWQQDFKMPKQNLEINTCSKFYQDIKITKPRNIFFDDYCFDIKVPWELSRFQHTFFLGRAYQIAEFKKTGSGNRYAQSFFNQIQNWLGNNKYLLGINWMCPMDIAIRAINWIWGFYFFNKVGDIEFWEKFVCSLYDHAIYLESNWETSDKPNNHYLSDLLGYLYLCMFFKDSLFFAKRAEWCFKKILDQFEHQIQLDGSSYEGSTCYHRLDTEIFLHFKILCEIEGRKLPPGFINKFSKMLKFFNDCHLSSGQILQVGDNDSGKIVAGIEINETSEQHLPAGHSWQAITHPNFGLTIIKNQSWNVFFRHHVVDNSLRQPSGHFHQDSLSVSFSVDDHPVLIDPGSFVYTANPRWRNLFRSYESHNVFYLDDGKNGTRPTKLESLDLFQLPLKPNNFKETIQQNKNRYTISSHHKEYEHIGLIAKRKLEFDSFKTQLKISDSFEKLSRSTKTNLDQTPVIRWNFIFHPDIKVINKNSKEWEVYTKDKYLLNFKSNLGFDLIDWEYSPNYGEKSSCKKLVATTNFCLDQQWSVSFTQE
jgi:hypothetical protein